MDRQGEERGEDRAGLVALGLIMELVGSVVAAYLIVKALEPVLDRVFSGFWYRHLEWQSQGWVERAGEAPPRHVILLAVIGILRALMHRRAGAAILYRPDRAASALLTYAAVALGHTALCFLALRLHGDERSMAWTVGACLSVGWPIALLVALRLPAFRRALRGGSPATCASAPDQVGALMVFLGLVGALVALLALYAAIDGLSTWSSMSWIPIPIAGLLCVRSAVHVQVGVRLVGREAGADGSLGVARYLKVAMATAGFSWIALLVVMRSLGEVPYQEHLSTEHTEIARAGLCSYLLVVWPALLHRLARARADATELAISSGRPSSALPALGWLLLAAGAVQVGVAGLGLLLGEERLTWILRSFVDLPVNADGLSRGPWLQLLLAVPQIWVALELLCGSTRRRRAATLYAACASVVTVVSIQADQELLMKVIGHGVPDVTALAPYLPVAFWLLVPVATLVFVQHQLRREGARPAVDAISGEG